MTASLEIDSELGKGTTVTMVFPAKRVIFRTEQERICSRRAMADLSIG